MNVEYLSPNILLIVVQQKTEETEKGEGRRKGEGNEQRREERKVQVIF